MNYQKNKKCLETQLYKNKIKCFIDTITDVCLLWFIVMRQFYARKVWNFIQSHVSLGRWGFLQSDSEDELEIQVRSRQIIICSSHDAVLFHCHQTAWQI